MPGQVPAGTVSASPINPEPRTERGECRRDLSPSRTVLPVSADDESLFDELATTSPPVDETGGALVRAVESLRRRGVLAAALPSAHGGDGLGVGVPDGARSVAFLVRLAEISLPLARVFEGHVNALALVARHGDEALVSRVAAAVSRGALLGVWGADGDEPVRIRSDERLVGSKRFASGLGVVEKALITARTTRGPQLCLVDVTDPARMDHSDWSMAGMQASVSGDYRFDGLGGAGVERVGQADVLGEEPGFFGGAWRIAALQLGGVFGVLEGVREALAAHGRLDDVHQRTRLTPPLYRALGAVGLVVAAARRADGEAGERDPEAAVAQSVFARLLTEEIGLSTIATAERCIGLALHRLDSPVGARTRDLSVYLRQAAPDALLQRAGAYAYGREERLAAFGAGS